MSHRFSWRAAAQSAALVVSVLGAASSPRAVADTRTITVDASAAPVSIAFSDSGARIVADPTSTGWDISVEKTTVTLNSAASGARTVTGFCICQGELASDVAVAAMTEAAELAMFDSVTASRIPAAARFTADAFSAHPWYRYNATGSDNQIWPAGNVYLIQRGTAVFKLQLIDYYSAAGEPRHVTIRYARLRG